MTAKPPDPPSVKPAKAILEALQQHWRDENQGVLDDANAFLAQYDLWSDGKRQF
jgi:hypothetical protein